MKCLIIAAGRGSRLRSKTQSKPLLPILGVPLIERVIRSAKEAGADDFYVVVGHKAEKVQAFLNDLSIRIHVNITNIFNDQWGKTENGLSVLKARDYINEPFLLLMTDHLFDPDIARTILKTPLGVDEIVLAVDSDIKNTLIDNAEATRIFQESGKVRSIGKDLLPYNSYDTGIFYCTPVIFEALEHTIQNGNSLLSEAVLLLAAQGRVKAVEVHGKFWIDIDNPVSVSHAEHAMLMQFRNKPSDGPVSRYLNRPLSIHLSRYLAHYHVSPNRISLFSFFCSLAGAFLFILGSYFALAIGGILAQTASIIDGCDGEVARLTYRQSSYGSWLDSVLDRYADALLLFTLTWHGFLLTKETFYILTGFMAIIGSFMVSYTADKYDRQMSERVARGGSFGFRIGRDIRIMLIFIGALTNQVFLTLLIIATVMNIETIRRLVVCRNE